METQGRRRLPLQQLELAARSARLPFGSYLGPGGDRRGRRRRSGRRILCAHPCRTCQMKREGHGEPEAGSSLEKCSARNRPIAKFRKQRLQMISLGHGCTPVSRHACVTITDQMMALDVGVERVLFLGSSCIYPARAPQPIKEECLLTGHLEPTNDAYAIAKIAGIMHIQSVRRQYGLPGYCDAHESVRPGRQLLG